MKEAALTIVPWTIRKLGLKISPKVKPKRCDNTTSLEIENHAMRFPRSVVSEEMLEVLRHIIALSFRHYTA